MVDVAREERLTQDSNAPLRENGIHFFKMKTLPPFEMATHLHMHDAIEFIYVVEGSIKVSYDDKDFVAFPGDLILFRSRGIHCMYTEGCEKNNYYVLKISLDFLTKIFNPSTSQRILLRFLVFDSNFKYIWRSEELKGTNIYNSLCGLIRENEEPSKLSVVNQLSHVLSIVHEVYGESSVDVEKQEIVSGPIYKALIYVNDNFDSDISAEEISKRFGMSLGHFSRSFKAIVGKSFRDYVIQIRLNKADQLILNSDMSIIEIAMVCGYPSVSHFIAQYKKFKGSTPLKTRKANL